MPADGFCNRWHEKRQDAVPNPGPFLSANSSPTEYGEWILNNLCDTYNAMLDEKRKLPAGLPAYRR